MSRPNNVRNPFDWKRSMIRDFQEANVIGSTQTRRLLRMVDADEKADREEGERELKEWRERRKKLPWWKVIGER